MLKECKFWQKCKFAYCAKHLECDMCDMYSEYDTLSVIL